MGEGQQPGVSVSETPAGTVWSMALWGLLALVAHLALLDAAVETFWSGSPLRWWICPALVLFTALSVWLWRPGGRLLSRFGLAPAASTPVMGLVALLAVTAWLPGGHDSGLRMLMQPSGRLITSVLAAGVLLAAVALLTRSSVLPPTARLVARVVVTCLALYAVASLGFGLRQNASFASLLQGAAMWRRLPRWFQGPMVGALALVPAGVLALLSLVVARVRGKEPVRLLLNQAVALAMIAVMAFSGVVVPAVVPTATAWNPSADLAVSEPPQGPEAADRLDRLFQSLEVAQREVPRDTFDPDFIVKKVGTDHKALFEWVRDNTTWVPYRGVLRGPVGVLMDRLGNGLDRSLLLAELLRRAGHTVRLAHTTLSEVQARQLLGRTRPVRLDRMSAQEQLSTKEIQAELERRSVDFGVDASQTRRMLEQARIKFEKVQEDLAETIDSQSKELLAALGGRAEQLRNEREANRERDLGMMTDAWWVQRQDGPNWVDLDPLLPDAVPGFAPAPAEDTHAPAEVGPHHEVTVRVIIEQCKGSERVEKVALSHAFRTVDALGQPIVLLHLPLKWPKDRGPLVTPGNASEFTAASLDQQEWLPLLSVGKSDFSRSVFTDKGELKDKPSGNAVGQGVTTGFGSLFGGGETEKDPGNAYLTAEWIEYETRVPGQPPQTVRRQVFDLLGPAARRSDHLQASAPVESQRLQRAFLLAGASEVLLLGSALSTEFVDYRAAESLTANRKPLVNLVRKGDAVTVKDSEALTPLPSPLLALAQARFALGRETVYLDSTNILTRHLTLIPKPGGGIAGSQVIDIVRNDVAVVADSRRPAFDVRVRQGVIDTNVEALMLPSSGRSGMSAGEASRRAVRDGKWLLLSRESLSVATSGLPADLVARASVDVSGGQFVVVPRMAKRGPTDAWCWWRIDARSGTTLGMDELGRGGADVEYAALTVQQQVYVRLLMAAYAATVCLWSQVAGEAMGLNNAKLGRTLVKCFGTAVAAYFGVDAKFTWARILAGTIAAFVVGSTA
jgi:hypothetical protein